MKSPALTSGEIANISMNNARDNLRTNNALMKIDLSQSHFKTLLLTMEFINNEVVELVEDTVDIVSQLSYQQIHAKFSHMVSSGVARK